MREDKTIEEMWRDIPEIEKIDVLFSVITELLSPKELKEAKRIMKVKIEELVEHYNL